MESDGDPIVLYNLIHHILQYHNSQCHWDINQDYNLYQDELGTVRRGSLTKRFDLLVDKNLENQKKDRRVFGQITQLILGQLKSAKIKYLSSW